MEPITKQEAVESAERIDALLLAISEEEASLKDLADYKLDIATVARYVLQQGD